MNPQNLKTQKARRNQAIFDAMARYSGFGPSDAATSSNAGNGNANLTGIHALASRIPENEQTPQMRKALQQHRQQLQQQQQQNKRKTNSATQQLQQQQNNTQMDVSSHYSAAYSTMHQIMNANSAQDSLTTDGISSRMRKRRRDATATQSRDSSSDLNDDDDDEDDDDMNESADKESDFDRDEAMFDEALSSTESTQKNTTTNASSSSSTPNSGASGRLPGGKPSKELEQLMTRANNYYLNRKLDDAKKVLLQVMKMRPNWPETYQLMALIGEEDDDPELHLQCELIYALLQNDYASWREVVRVARKHGNQKIELYAWRRIEKHARLNEEVLFNLGKLFLERGYKRPAYRRFRKIIKHNVKHVEATIAYCQFVYDEFNRHRQRKRSKEQMAEARRRAAAIKEAAARGKKLDLPPEEPLKLGPDIAAPPSESAVLDQRSMFAFLTREEEDSQFTMGHLLARKALQRYFSLVPPEEWDATLMNLMCDICVMESQHQIVMSLIQTYARIQQVEYAELPPDLQLQYGASLLRMQRYPEAKQLFNNLLDSQPTHDSWYFELYCEVADRFIQSSMPVDAIFVLEEMLQKFQQEQQNRSMTPAEKQRQQYAYRLLGDCYLHQGDHAKAAEWYEKYIACSPSDEHQYRLILSDVYNDMGDTQRAIHALSRRADGASAVGVKLEAGDDDDVMEDDEESSDSDQGDTAGAGDGTTTRKRRRRRIDSKMRHAILKAVRSAHLVEHSPEQFIKFMAPIYVAVSNSKRQRWNTKEREDPTKYFVKRQTDQLKRLKEPPRGRLTEAQRNWTVSGIVSTLDHDRPGENSPPGDVQLINLLIKLAKTLYNKKDTDRAFFLLEHALQTKITSSKRMKLKIRFTLVRLYVESGRYRNAYKNLKYAIRRDPYNGEYWDLLYTLIHQGIRHVKTFISYQIQYHPNCLPALLLMGHHALSHGTDIIALGYYMWALKYRPEDPLVNLCIGAAHLSALHRSNDRHSAVLHAFTYLYRYADYSKDFPIEVNYNLARAFQHLNINTLAVEYYNKVLASREHQIEGNSGLIHSAAINLSVLYKSTGNPQLAHSILFDSVQI